MDDAEFNRELAELFRAEEVKRDGVYLESIQIEVEKLREAVLDHAIAFAELDYTDPDAVCDAGEKVLRWIQQEHLDEMPHITSGRLQVSGTGAVIVNSEQDGRTYASFIAPGDTLQGSIVGYDVVPVPWHGTAYDPVENVNRDDIENLNPWGLSVILNEVRHVDSGGNTAELEDTVILAPLIYPDFRFDKVISREDILMPPNTTAEREQPGDVTRQLRGVELLELHCDCENDLNYGEYESQELQQRRIEYSKQLALSVEDTVPADSILVVTADEVIDHEGSTEALDEAFVYFNGATIIRHQDQWRVAYGFSVPTGEGTYKQVHALPLSIRRAFLQD